MRCSSSSEKPSSIQHQLQPPPSKRTGRTPRAAWMLFAVSTLPVTLTTATRGSSTSGADVAAEALDLVDGARIGARRESIFDRAWSS